MALRKRSDVLLMTAPLSIGQISMREQIVLCKLKVLKKFSWNSLRSRGAMAFEKSEAISYGATPGET